MNPIVLDLKTLVANAIGADVISGSATGVLALMGRGSHEMQRDVPAASEMFALLNHCLDRFPVRNAELDTGKAVLALAPGVAYDADTDRIVALLPIAKGTLKYVAHWVVDRLPSAYVKHQPGVLALAFSVETRNETRYLMPEWFAAFYVDGSPNHCVPVLSLESVLSRPEFSGDWVRVALHRMEAFALPHEDALAATNAD